MRIKEIKCYQFDELPDDAKEKALMNLCDINVDYEWWDSVYEDAENIGLKLTGFDLDRNRHATGELIFEPLEVAKAILSDHGEMCDTYQLAKEFKAKYEPKYNKWYNSVLTDYDLENDLDNMAEDFERSLVEEYSVILQKEYEYLTSEEAIIETIRANGYEFDEYGNMI